MHATRTLHATLFLCFCAAFAAAQTPVVEMEPDAIIADAAGARDVELSRFGSYVAVYDTTEGNSIRLFNADLEQLWRTRLSYYWGGSLEQGSIIQFAPDESYIVFPGVRTENDICVADSATGKQIQILRGHEDDVEALALSPDGRWLASAAYHRIILWEHTDAGFEQRGSLDLPDAAVHSIEFLADSSRIVLTTTQEFTRALTIYGVADGTFTKGFSYSFDDHNISNEIDQVAVSTDGAWLAAGYRDSILIFALAGDKAKLVQQITGIDVGTVASLAFAPDSVHLASGHYRFVRWWNLASGTWTEGPTSSTQSPMANDIEISPNGRALYLASRADENAVARFIVTGVTGSPLAQVASAFHDSFAPAQRAVLTDALAASIVREIGPDALEPRDMFETSDEYTARVGAAEATMRAGVFHAIETYYNAAQAPNNAARYDVLVPLHDRGTYDIDTKRYDLLVLDEPAWVTLDRDAARSLYQSWGAARLRATRYVNDGTDDYADFRLVHPDGTVYPVVFERNPFTGERMNTAASVIPAIAVGPSVVLRNLRIDGIFPTLYARYAVEPMGRVTIANTGSGIVSDVDVRFAIEGLGSEHRVDTPQSIPAGQSVLAELSAPMSANVLQSGEGGTAMLTLRVSYRRGDVTYRDAISRQVRVLNRNAIQWIDDRRVGSFMSVSQPAVLTWSGQVAAAIRTAPTPALTRNFLYALRLFESLTAAGIDYVVDPNSAYETLSRDAKAVDFLRFPAETLGQGVGDCDDLSVLYATLLESVGVDTAFLTTPGHIFVAFDTGIGVDQAARIFESTARLVIRDGTAWMPIETTLVRDGFTKAWQTAAVEWQQAEAAGTSGFFTARDAWNDYPPVAAPIAAPATRPELAKIADASARELSAYRDIELAPKIARLSDSANADAPETQNRIGVLYATYGLLDQASEHFQTALVSEEYVPALINQANILSMKSRNDEARAYLERARAVDPQNGRVLIGLAFSQLESGNEDEARNTYEVASRVSPALARKFPLFAPAADDSARAGLAQSIFSVDWVDETP